MGLLKVTAPFIDPYAPNRLFLDSYKVTGFADDSSAGTVGGSGSVDTGHRLIQIRTGATASSVAARYVNLLRLGNTITTSWATQSFTISALINLSIASDANAIAWMGLMQNTTAADPSAKGMAFRFDGNAGGTWDVKGLVYGAGLNVNDLSYALTSDTVYIAVLEYKAAVSATFSIYSTAGALLVSLTTSTDLPTTTSASQQWVLGITNGATAADRRLVLNMLQYESTF